MSLLYLTVGPSFFSPPFLVRVSIMDCACGIKHSNDASVIACLCARGYTFPHHSLLCLRHVTWDFLVFCKVGHLSVVTRRRLVIYGHPVPE